MEKEKDRRTIKRGKKEKWHREKDWWNGKSGSENRDKRKEKGEIERKTNWRTERDRRKREERTYPEHFATYMYKVQLKYDDRLLQTKNMQLTVTETEWTNERHKPDLHNGSYERRQSIVSRNPNQMPRRRSRDHRDEISRHRFLLRGCCKTLTIIIYYLGHINLLVIYRRSSNRCGRWRSKERSRSMSQTIFADHRDVRTPRRYDNLIVDVLQRLHANIKPNCKGSIKNMYLAERVFEIKYSNLFEFLKQGRVQKG